MKTPRILGGIAVALALTLTGCETRSISDSGFGSADYPSLGYRGELTEFEVLGIEARTDISEADIAAELKLPQKARLERTSRILLIQSGADFPDAPMQEALSRHFNVMAFSGKPAGDRIVRTRWQTPAPATQTGTAIEPQSSYSKSLRLVAARGGYDKIICYWGVLESARINQVTKLVSWVPIVGFTVPDEREDLRIRLKAVIIDVATGRWTAVMPKPVAQSGLSTILSRKDKDQALVALLKDRAYQDLATLLVETYTE
jgi:hypothetical protein